MHFRELVSICQGSLVQFSTDRSVQTLLIDSRKAVISDGSVFFAIQGARHDGHKFLKELYHLGLRQFVVEKDISGSSFPGANILKVGSCMAALQAVATHHRNQFHIPVVGITGSNGKTIVKEWLFQTLSPELQIVRNPASYNSQVGVPLSVWQLSNLHELAIFEAGISTTGEMEKLHNIIQPTIGVFTNIGSAHDEGFASPKQKAEEKAKLFQGCRYVVCNQEHALITEVLREKNIPAFTWSLGNEGNVQIQHVNENVFHVTTKSGSFDVALPFKDRASQENVFHVLTFMVLWGCSPAVIAERIKSLQPVAMRLELKQGINGCIVIDDTYNNDLAGLRISLDFLKNQQKAKKTLILSDILQSGLSDLELVKSIRDAVASSRINKVIGVGPVLHTHKQFFPNAKFYRTTQEFLQDFHSNEFSDEVILVKGARSFQFEKIARQLERKVHGTVMEINLNAMVHNLNYFKSCVKPGVKIMAMVKAFAYGSGSEEVANLLQYHRIDYLGVAYADEGIELRKNNISLPIMVMNPTEESFVFLKGYKLEPEMYNLRILRSLTEFLHGEPCDVHIKLDTGMHRLGLEEQELNEVIEILKVNKNLRVVSLFSHLSGADEQQHDDFSKIQAEAFVRMADRLDQALGYKPFRHILNTPGILRLPQYQFDLVRLGIGLYGVDPTAEINKNLQPVATLKTVISQIKKINAGETIGYGRRGKADHDMTLGTLAIGYADGFSRSFSRGRGKVLIHGKLAPVVGNVCMDMTMVDITGIAASEGDEAIIFGPDLPIQEVAKWIDTIPYELLTSTSERVKRMFFAESV
ncbi:MAG TPA: bifunctional UDP-N-acetylmuramoyl-tripeptide:D-alanyl-D-alanine ligase/alanine racemase [Cyclobacteriaceae bacterium]|nr:bifunctional UDP-N-acetylmuramoyl-tripeptide:D-alanyl-D-alanine ligase/alanine racemase [Cyclobacteriaceae bacterium]